MLAFQVVSLVFLVTWVLGFGVTLPLGCLVAWLRCGWLPGSLVDLVSLLLSLAVAWLNYYFASTVLNLWIAKIPSCKVAEQPGYLIAWLPGSLLVC